MATQTHAARRLLDHALASAAKPTSDRDLLARFVAGDQSTFAAIVDRHGPMLRGCCRRWVDDRHLADDVLQATFVVLARKAKSIRRRDSLAAWLYGVARRVARRARLAEEARSRHERRVASRAKNSPNAECDELLRALDEELTRLPEGERATLVLCYLEGRTQDEAADQLGLPLITVRRRLERGRERLRTRLTRRGLTLGAALVTGTVAIDSPALCDDLRQVLVKMSGTNSPRPAVAALADGLRLTAVPRFAMWSVVAVLACGALIGAGSLRTPARVIPAEPPKKSEPEANRDRFNDPLPAGAIARLGTLAFRHGEEINRLYFAPDGKSLLTGSNGLRCRWQLDAGHEVQTLDYRDAARGIRADCLSDDGKTMVIVYGRTDRIEPATVVVRDAATGNAVREFTVPRADYAYVFSPDARLLGIARGQETEIWSSATGQKLFVTPQGYPRFSADGRTVVLCDPRHKISVWDVESGQRRREFNGAPQQGREHQYKAMALSRDAKWLVTHGRSFSDPKPSGPGLMSTTEIPDESLNLWDIEKGQLAFTLKTGWMLRSTFAFSPDGRTLLVAVSGKDWTYSVQRWEVTTGKLQSTWPTGLDSCTAVALSPDGKTLATATESGCVRRWDTVNRRELADDAGHLNSVHGVAFSRDGAILRTHSYDRMLIDWDVREGRPKTRRQEIERDQGGGGFTYSADHQVRLAVVSNPESRIMVTHLDSDRPPRELGRVPNLGRGFGISPDGRRVVVVGDGPSVRTWDTESGKLLGEWKFQCDDRGSFVVWPLREGRLLVTINGLLITFDTDGREFRRWRVEKPQPKPGESIDVIMHPSSDGRYVACFTSSGRDWLRGTLEVREVESGRVVRRIADDVARYPVAFSADARRLATVSPEQAIVVWDIGTGERRHEFKGHRGRVNCLDFSLDGTRLASGSQDCTALVWDVGP